MTAPEKVCVLCVDDEPEVLQGLVLNLARHYDVLTAVSGLAGLAVLRVNPSVAVIISDMRMPGMSGSEFLAKSIEIAPKAQRILLTGQADVASAISAVNEGEVFRFLTKPCAPPALLKVVAEAIVRVRSEELERTGVRRAVERKQLQVDALTGLASRHRLMSLLEAAAYSDTPADSALAAFFVDVGSCGQLDVTGDRLWEDEVAKAVGHQLSTSCPDAVCVSRWGADQFVVLVPCSDVAEEGLRSRGAELRRQVGAAPGLQPAWAHLPASVGVAKLNDRLQWQRLVQQAALAAREAGAGGVRVYQAEALSTGMPQQQLLQAFRLALAAGELDIHYQPIWNVSTGRVHSFEALVRWDHHSLGSVAPDRFIPIVEQSGDVVGLGRWVLWRACHELAGMSGDGQIGLAVNVSPRQVVDEGFLPHLESCLASSGLDPQRLELEITETALATDLAELCGILEQVRLMKVRLAVDDFGTGYSSLLYLSRLPIDTIKVDRVFVQDFHRGGRTIIKAALAVAEDFGKLVIIEGVETAESLQEIIGLGASLVQGFLFSRPMPRERVQAWLSARHVGVEAPGAALAGP